MLLVPYNVDVPMRRYPWANWGLIALTCVISLMVLFTAMGVEEEEEAEGLMFWLLWRGELFRVTGLLTYLVTHGDFIHLAGNMLFLFVFGNAVNARLGHWQFLGLYVVAGVLAGLGWLAFDGGMALLGASGAIMGVVGIFVVLYPRNDVSVYWNIFVVRMGTFRLSSYWVVLMYIVFDVWGMVRSGMGAGGGVAYVSHVTGMLFGFGVTAGLVWLGVIQPDPQEENLLQAVGIKTKGEREEAVAAGEGLARRYAVEALDRGSGMTVRFTMTARSQREILAAAEKKKLVVRKVTVQG